MAKPLAWRWMWRVTAVEGLRLMVAVRPQGLPYDLVLMDWKMPVMDGVETVRQMQANSREQNACRHHGHGLRARRSHEQCQERGVQR
jgi:CheY-like chemotaxis protein